MEYTSVDPEQFAAIEDLADWRFILGAIHADFAAGSFPAAAGLVGEIATIAEEADHHPDVSLRYPDRVHVTLTTHATGGLTTLDTDVARRISALAETVGATSHPEVGQVTEVAIDTMDADRIRPFWAAVLAYDDRDGWLVDPRRIGPPMWFQQMTEPRMERQRFHLDVSVPNDIAEARVAAGLAAGGVLVTDRYAPSWWVLADADGNEACICTWQGRSPAGYNAAGISPHSTSNGRRGVGQ